MMPADTEDSPNAESLDPEDDEAGLPDPAGEPETTEEEE